MRTVQDIDRDIFHNRRELLRHEIIKDALSATDWQAAWDNQPTLKAIEDLLFLERGYAQIEQLVPADRLSR